jgi:hypothetical protein
VRFAFVRIVEIAACQQRDAHGFEIARRDESVVDQRGLIQAARRLVGIHQIRNPVFADHRKLVDRAHGVGAGKLRKLRQNPFQEFPTVAVSVFGIEKRNILRDPGRIRIRSAGTWPAPVRPRRISKLWAWWAKFLEPRRTRRLL